MNKNDSAALFIIGSAMTIVLIPFGLIYYLYLKSKSKRILEEAYKIEKDLENSLKFYIDVDSKFKNLSIININTKEELYFYFELLDKKEYFSKSLMVNYNILKDKINFLDSMKILRFKDEILEKDFSKYDMNFNYIFTNIEFNKNNVYKLFRHFN